MSQDPQARDAPMAAEIEADVGVLQVGAIYAEAFLGAAQSAGRLESALDELDSLVADVLNRYPKLEEILASKLVSHEDKIGILDRVLGSSASSVLLNFLKVVARHERLDCLRAMHQEAHELYDKLQDRVRVQVSTARPISDEVAGRIAARLQAVLQGQPRLKCLTDPDLIGGTVIRVGDTVYDGSIANQLENMRQQMIQRSAYEIQSRRDRFRDPAGN